MFISVGDLGEFRMLMSLVVLLTMYEGRSSSSLSDILHLKRDLFQNRSYNTDLRPIVNQTKEIQVNIMFTITAVGEVRLTDGVADFTGYFSLTWMDELLQWNSDDYNGITKLTLSGREIWVPKFMQWYSIQRDFALAMAVLYSNGLVAWFPLGFLRSACDQDMRYYPFDYHKCTIGISESIHDITQLQLISTEQTAKIYVNITHTGQWKIGKTKAEVIESNNSETGLGFSTFQISVDLHRRSEFLVIHLCVPYIIVVLLNIFTYLTPLCSGERVSFAVTLMLAMTFYTTKISETVPENSVQLSYTSFFTLLANIYAACSVAISVILCKVSTYDTNPVSPCLTRLLHKQQGHKEQKVNCKVIEINKQGRRNLNQTNSADRKSRDTLKHRNVSIESGTKDKANEFESATLEDAPKERMDQRLKEPIDVTWKQVAEYFDRTVFYCNAFVIFVTCLIFLGFVVFEG